MTEETAGPEAPSTKEANAQAAENMSQQEPTPAQESRATSGSGVAAPQTAVQAEPPKRKKRWPVVLAIAGGAVLLFLFFIVSVTLLDFTESTAFCTSCHIMYPEETTHDFGSHANTDCGTCHVGPGVLPAIRAKLDNIQYLWKYPLGLYEKPLPVPVTSMRPAEVVCYQCHNPQKFYNDTLVTIPDYAEDEANSLTETRLAVRTGGGETSAGLGRGIHWHVENPVYYIAADEKLQDIPWVQATYNGITTTYQSVDSTLSPAQIASAEKREMDCLDCHNRATHNYNRPGDALDAAIATGNIPADLPYVKRLGVELLEKTYATEEEAAQAIAAAPDFWKTNYPELYTTRKADIDKAVAGYQTIFNNTQFPFMDVTWEAYPNNIGHKNFPGCFRCHDGKHLSQDNQAIRMECNLCHSVPLVAEPGKLLPAVSVTAGAEPESHHSTTWLAEHRYKFDATCANCHTVDNPGGSDNSSFCSNSACHATQWKYAGLNAPRIRELSAPPKVPSSGVPNPIPHPISSRTDCKICHGPEGVRPAPENHASFTPDMCTGCHQPKLEETPPPAPTPAGGTTPEATPTPAAAGGPPQVPHAIEGRADCNACHGQGAMKPAPASHASFTSDMCLNCHKPVQGSMPEATPQETPTPSVVGEPPQIPHAIESQADCNACHGQGAMKPAPASHATFTSGMCLNCHQPVQGSAPEATPTPAESAVPESGSESEGPPAIPHELTGRDNCLMCHDPQGGIKPAPADHVGRTVENCQLCHKPAQ